MYAVLYASAAALLASTALAGPGQAIVYNGCNYDVHMLNTPSNDNNPAHKEISGVIKPGTTYAQTYVKLDNLAGWSIKLSKDGKTFNNNIMQYEYTYQGDNTIWYDLSGVDGNPWNGDWLISAQGGVDPNSKLPCAPKQQYYRCPTDDGYGMQSQCTDDAVVTVHLCAAESPDKNILASMSSLANAAKASPPPCATSDVPAIGGSTVAQATSVAQVISSAVANAGKNPGAVLPAASSAAPVVNTPVVNTPVVNTSPAPVNIPTTTSTAAPPPPATTHTSATQAPQQNHNPQQEQHPTTFVTSRTAQVVDTNAHVVTEVITYVTTAQATQTVWARHEHHHNH